MLLNDRFLSGSVSASLFCIGIIATNVHARRLQRRAQHCQSLAFKKSYKFLKKFVCTVEMYIDIRLFWWDVGSYRHPFSVTWLYILPDWVGCSNGMIWVSSDSIFSCDFRSDGHMTLYIAWLGRLLKWDDMGIIGQHFFMRLQIWWSHDSIYCQIG